MFLNTQNARVSYFQYKSFVMRETDNISFDSTDNWQLSILGIFWLFHVSI